MSANLQKPLVSVSMITYNHALYIEQAIEGVLEQITEFDIELVIANDCSPDDTDAIVNDLIKNHPKAHVIRYFRHTKNIGMQPNGAFASKQCRGEYIAACEGDDYWTDPYKLQKQLTFMQCHPEMSFTFHGAGALAPDGTITDYDINPSFRDREAVNIKDFLKHSSASYPSASMMIRRDVIEDLPDWYLNAQVGDYPFIFMALEKGKIGYMKDTMCVYRVNAVNSWSSRNRNLRSRIKSHWDMIGLHKAINAGTGGKYRTYLPQSLLEYIFYKIKLKIKG